MELSAQKFFVLASFLILFAFALRKDRVFFVPFILLFYSNINGLLDWEDFAFKGFIKFQDYGLLITLGVIAYHSLVLRRSEPDYIRVARTTALYNIINVYWIFSLMLLCFSVLVQGFEWSIKMARTFFYGLVIYVAYQEIMLDPLVKYEKLLKFLMWVTLFFGSLYIVYNLTHIPIYPKGAHEIFQSTFSRYLSQDVTRNFSGFPVFAQFFIFYFVDRLVRGEGNQLLNLISTLILATCVFMLLTRYTLFITLAMVILLILYRQHNIQTLIRLSFVAVAFVMLGALIPIVTESYYSVLIGRFDELQSHGLIGSHNSQVRIQEFAHIFSNVLDFNPFFGFGFTLPKSLGYSSNVLHAGSADNGYSNLLGVSGFLGLILFFTLIGCWLVINRRLAALKAENLSRVNFVFIFFVLAAMMNDAHAGYLHYFGIFMVYDLFAYAYLKHKLKNNLKIDELNNKGGPTYPKTLMGGEIR